MTFSSINPYNNEVINTYESYDQQKINEILLSSARAFEQWRKSSLGTRKQVLLNAAQILINKQEEHAKIITQEMGKPFAEAKAEVRKCALVCEYYAQNAASFLAPTYIETDANESFVSIEPLGCVLAIMPWNYPFWQVFRFLAPAIMAGNVALLKHAPNVFGCAIEVAKIMEEAGCPEAVFQNLIIHHDEVKAILENDIVRAVSLTGSEKAGASVASIAGQNIKKSLLELGGSNAFIVLADADIEHAVSLGIQSRMQNAGQSCIAAKRFIVVEEVYEQFVVQYLKAAEQIKTGNPLDETTQMGSLARIDLANKLAEQVKKSVQQGAIIRIGGVQNGTFYAPTVLTNITADMPVFKEEVFGPVAPIMKVKDKAEAIEIARKTRFGLGLSIFTKDIEEAKKMIPLFEDGAVFVNALVKSDPQLPFGGAKKSGFGRELSKEGILEFVNKKTVYISK